MIADMLSKAITIIVIGMAVVFSFILLMSVAIRLNARIIKALGKGREKGQ